MKNFLLLALVALFVGSVAPANGQESTDKDIVDIAVEAGTFQTLVAAVTAADLVSVLKSEGPFTVFAPTDEAFAALPEGTVADLLKPENKDQLIAVLTYHVVAGKVTAADVVKLTEATTVQGTTVDIMVMDGTVMIDKAHVVAADIMASNGVIHVIDKVLLPSLIRKTLVIRGCLGGGRPLSFCPNFLTYLQSDHDHAYVAI